MEEEVKTEKKGKNKRASLLYFLSGGILKEGFVVRHTRFIVFIVVLLFFFISNRYACLLKLREIDRLQQRLQDVKQESVALSGELTGSNRLSQMEELVKKQGLDLEAPQSPPYILHK